MISAGAFHSIWPGMTLAQREGVGEVVAAPVFSVAPGISGTPTVGQQLSSTTGTASGDPTFAYQWTAGGTPISGATSSTYTLEYAQEGQDIRCEVTATNAGGSDTEASNALTFAAIELMTFGDYSSSSGFINNAAFSITGGQLVGSSVPAFGVSSRAPLDPPGLVAGVTYTVSFTIVSVTVGGLRPYFSGGTQRSGTFRTTVGTHTEDLVANSGNNLLGLQAQSGTGFSGVADNFSVKKK